MSELSGDTDGSLNCHYYISGHIHNNSIIDLLEEGFPIWGTSICGGTCNNCANLHGPEGEILFNIIKLTENIYLIQRVNTSY